MAQTFTLQNRRNMNGPFTTPDALAPDGFQEWRLRTNMNADDLADPSKFLTLNLEVSDDGGNTWRPFAGLTWQGVPGINPRTGLPYGNPTLGGNMAELVGKRVRATGLIASDLRVGFVIELLP